MLRVAFVGTFAARLAEPVRRRLVMPCDIARKPPLDPVAR
jgi:hypothetical protein